MRDYRARLVGRELKAMGGKQECLFAATPPLESLRFVISIAASRQRRPEPFRIMATDVKRAYFYAAASRSLYIEIPEEDLEEDDEGMVGQLQLSLYGTRDAAANSTACYTDFLQKLGFEQGKASPCNFYHPKKELSLTVHGDDFTTAGTERALPGSTASSRRPLR